MPDSARQQVGEGGSQRGAEMQLRHWGALALSPPSVNPIVAVHHVLLSPLQQHSMGVQDMGGSGVGDVSPSAFPTGCRIAGEWGQGALVLPRPCFAERCLAGTQLMP